MEIFEGLDRLDHRVILPLLPRTRKIMQQHRIHLGSNVRCVEALSYLDMMKLQGNAACVLTDSGGVQKEAYDLGVPCVTLRTETEWVETVTAAGISSVEPPRAVSLREFKRWNAAMLLTPISMGMGVQPGASSTFWRVLPRENHSE